MMNAYTTHPSVRIKGTENNYEPVACTDPNCMHKLNPHMHCPFCVKTDSYLDPVILKAHYRVKHVDKGIEFAGLKVLRCCDHCDIVGTIKGVKEFKGAHWHCYRCKNGFNRRDEAIKHYRTHFRNPQTTFQIQITQEVNQPPMTSEVEQATQQVAQQSVNIIHPTLSESVMTTSASDSGIINVEPGTTLANGKVGDGDMHVSIAANETVGAEGETIMIIHEGHLDTSQIGSDNNTAHTYQVQNLMQESIEVESGDDVGQTTILDQVSELQAKLNQLNQEKLHMQEQLQEEINQLQLQVQMQAEEIATYQKREQELLAQLSIPLDDRIQELLAQLRSDHEDLLHQQLAVLRRECINTLNADIKQANNNKTACTEYIQLNTDPKQAAPSQKSGSELMSQKPKPILVLGGSSGTEVEMDQKTGIVELVDGLGEEEEEESKMGGRSEMVEHYESALHVQGGPLKQGKDSDVTIHVLQMPSAEEVEDSGMQEAETLAQVVTSDASLSVVQSSSSPSYEQEDMSDQTLPPVSKKSRISD